MSDPEGVIRNRRWIRREQPFPHIRCRQVFTGSFYRPLASEFEDLLRLGLSETLAPGRFSRSIAGYDAYGIGFDETLGGCLSFFLSSAWHDLVAALFSVRGTGYVNVGAHHHRVGSTSGAIHNDFNPVWFPRLGEGRICCPKHRLCDYKTGAGPLPASEKVEVVRAVAMIYYLANDGWKEGDGGETGLFDSPTAPLNESSILVPPENNSILLFECTPRSYHAFVPNPGRARNSIIMWVHRSKEDALARWHETDLERWRI